MIDLTDRVILVTGAAGGIGAATVRKVTALGAYAIAHDVRPPEDGERVLPLYGDLREPEAARALWEEAWAWKDRIDVLVNCAGIYAPAPVEADFADWTESWRRTLDVNLLAPAVLCREAILSYRGQGGGII